MRRVLVVGPAWVGDMVVAQSLFITLCRNIPDAQIDVVAPNRSLPLLARMPEVHQAISLPVGHNQLRLATRYSLGRRLRYKQYDRAIVIPRSFKSALIPFFARIPERTGYRGEMRYGLINDMRPLDKAVLTQTVQRYIALGQDPSATLPPSDIPHPSLTIDEVHATHLLQTLGISAEGRVAAFAPGAEYGPAKRWPAEYYAELARRLAQAGYQIWLLGSAKDVEVCRCVNELARGVAQDLSGKTRLEDIVDLISLTDFVVTNDSGLMHVAAAVGRPVLAIYGSSTPSYTPPLTNKADVFYLNLECSPCFERECPLGHLNCLKQIQVTDVYNACMKLDSGCTDGRE